MQSEDGINVNKRECGTFIPLLYHRAKFILSSAHFRATHTVIKEVITAVYIIDHTSVNTVIVS